MGAAIQFGIVEDTACQERDVQGREFLGAHQRQLRLGPRQRRLVAKLDLGGKASERRKPGGGNRRVRDTGVSAMVWRIDSFIWSRACQVRFAPLGRAVFKEKT